MSRRVLLAALSLAAQYADSLTIGGGEPTQHPDFWACVGLILAYNKSDGPPFIVTNGAQTEDALRLAELARRGVLEAHLSRDDFHGPVDDRVVRAFKPPDRNRYNEYGTDRDSRDLRGYHSPHGQVPVAAGRARFAAFLTRQDCCCEDLLVAPSGALWACGCRSRRLGTVFAPRIPRNWEHYTCAKQQPAFARPTRVDSPSELVEA